MSRDQIIGWVKDKDRFSTTFLCNCLWPEKIKINKSGSLYHPNIRIVSKILKTIPCLRQDKYGIWTKKYT